MKEQTLEQFKAMQRREMNDAISSGKLVNSVSGFVSSRMLDRSVMMNENKRIKKKWEKWAKETELKNQDLQK
tara:strand:- start:679 stop:894 length:216 start_codon:yes stop_codon:yes gene_type:complete